MYFINSGKCNSAGIACELRIVIAMPLSVRLLLSALFTFKCLLFIRNEMCFHFRRRAAEMLARLMCAAVQPFSERTSTHEWMDVRAIKTERNRNAKCELKFSYHRVLRAGANRVGQKLRTPFFRMANGT